MGITYWSIKKSSNTMISVKTYSKVMQVAGGPGKWCHRALGDLYLSATPAWGPESSLGCALRRTQWPGALTLSSLGSFAFSVEQEPCSSFPVCANRPARHHSQVRKQCHLERFKPANKSTFILENMMCFPPWKSQCFGNSAFITKLFKTSFCLGSV